MLATIAEDGDAVVILDQTKLPQETAFVRLTDLAGAAHAIRSMQVRGAPLIGATAAYGVALGLREGKPFDEILATLAATRPTAVNLHWALERMKAALAEGRDAWQEARAIAREDAEANAAIGRYGLAILEEIARRKGRIEVMTHCNAGWLATVAHGTALAPIYAAHETGIAVHVWVSETRPRNQGRLTAWELAQSRVPHTFIADNAAGLLMMQGRVDVVIVGADRIAANGDTANKVGTYLKALAAHAHGVPFYVAAPVSTIDFACPDGTRIPIEERAAEEFGELHTPVANPAFDVTPAALISGIITEHGVVPADQLGRVKP
ncbi:MAG: S-methyl-5-thioribose-1-phosphate isomerase [Rhodocyclaceae bacterium]|jgi:methylthioribose-1-phosphate isomerase|nr:S-methyl-5-thioribose-1-phosphate isomerase [Rhodocyclaceae bacterium]